MNHGRITTPARGRRRDPAGLHPVEQRRTPQADAVRADWRDDGQEQSRDKLRHDAGVNQAAKASA